MLVWLFTFDSTTRGDNHALRAGHDEDLRGTGSPWNAKVHYLLVASRSRVMLSHSSVIAIRRTLALNSHHGTDGEQVPSDRTSPTSALRMELRATHRRAVIERDH